MKTLGRFLVLFALCFSLSCACSKDGGEICHLVPDKVDLTWESQQFQVTSLESYYVVTTIYMDDNYYDNRNTEELYHANESLRLNNAYSFDIEWLHWSYKKEDGCVTVSVDANETGKVRTAQINMGDGCDASARLTITQQPKE